jgi:hypothetical protein
MNAAAAPEKIKTKKIPADAPELDYSVAFVGPLYSVFGCG